MRYLLLYLRCEEQLLSNCLQLIVEASLVNIDTVHIDQIDHDVLPGKKIVEANRVFPSTINNKDKGVNSSRCVD